MKNQIEINLEVLQHIQDLKENLEAKGYEDPYTGAVLLWLNEELHIL